MQERGIVASLSGRRWRSLAIAASVAVLVVVADQVTTSWAEAELHRPVHLLGPLGLALRYNSGTAFSLFTGAGWWLVPVIVVLAAVVAWLAWRSRSLLLTVGYGLVLGGAVGNLADRLARGHHGDVVDFVTLSHWPTFNVADACITVGVVLVAVGWLRQPFSVSHRHGAPARPPTGRGHGGELTPSHEGDPGAAKPQAEGGRVVVKPQAEGERPEAVK